MITRQNYEELFLLYVDNELSAAERQLVDAFADENPDLRAELDLLLQCRLDPENSAYPEKASLFRHAVSEEELLLYVDGELDEQARSKVEERARMSPGINKALSLLRQTINEPDTQIVFRQKELLYRHERQRRAILWPLVRLTAAAVILLAVGVWVLFRTNGNNSTSTARRSDPVKKAALPARIPAKRSDQPVTPAPAPALYPSTIAQQMTEKHNKDSKVIVKPIEKRIKERVDGDDENQLALNVHPVNKAIPQTTASLTGTSELIRNGRSAVDIARIDEKALSHSFSTSLSGSTPLSGSTSLSGGVSVKGGTFATDALLREEGDDSPSDEGSMGDEAQETTSQKPRLRGMLRKVTRVFDKSADGGDGNKRNILIGNLQIALKR